MYGKKNKVAPPTTKLNKPSLAEEMRRRLHETLNNLQPKNRAGRRTVFAKKETTATITDLAEETTTNEHRLKRIGKHSKKEVKRAKIEEVQEEKKPCIVNQQDVEDLKLLEAVLSTKPEQEEENFDIDW